LQKYQSCCLITDAIIDGSIKIDSNGEDMCNKDNSVEMPRKDSELAINIDNDLNSDKCCEPLNLSNGDEFKRLNDSNILVLKPVQSNSFRAPKSHPFANCLPKKKLNHNIDGTIDVKNASFISLCTSNDTSYSDLNGMTPKSNLQDDDSETTKGSTISETSSETTPTKKLISTRPKLSRKVIRVTDDE
jgi:hypothetical protein